MLVKFQNTLTDLGDFYFYKTGYWLIKTFPRVSVSMYWLFTTPSDVRVKYDLSVGPVGLRFRVK